MQLKNYNKSLYFLGFGLLLFTFLFKYMTGSFLAISEESKKEMIKYEIDKRKQDISIVSLKASCLNFDKVLDTVLEEFKNKPLDCNTSFYEGVLTSSRDSAYYKIIEKMYEYAYYYDEELSNSGRIVYLYQDKNKTCTSAVKLVFTNKGEESLIASISNLPNYLACYCN
tara:strand:- start:1180 stop:1686 length:507 start_codon:yes stop_codon:yes gene_type:complete